MAPKKRRPSTSIPQSDAESSGTRNVEMLDALQKAMQVMATQIAEIRSSMSGSVPSTSVPAGTSTGQPTVASVQQSTPLVVTTPLPTQVTDTTAQRTSTDLPPPPALTSVGVDNITKFQKLKPPRFEGSSDYQVIDEWIDEMDTIFSYSDIAPEQWMPLAIFQLKGLARTWWKREKVDLPQQTTSWEDFKVRLLQKFLPSVEQQRLMDAFLHLQQGEMSVTDYEAQFMKLSRFAPQMVDTEWHRSQRFIGGLKPAAQQLVAAYNTLTYATTVEAALRVEYIHSKRTPGKDKGKKPLTESASTVVASAPAKKKQKKDRCSYCNIPGHTAEVCRKRQAAVHTAQAQPKTERLCSNCGRKGHVAATCRVAEITCHRCHKKGHYKERCPTLCIMEAQPVLALPPPTANPSQGHLSSVTRAEAPSSPRVIAGSGQSQ